MDEQLKARLLGAAILVIVAVLLIPELLSGRKAPEEGGGETPQAGAKRTYTIDLGGQGAVSRVETPSPRANEGEGSPGLRKEPDREAPAASPAAEKKSPPPVAAPAEAPEPAPPEAVAEASAPPASPSTDVPAATASGAWAVQVGAFGSEGAARKLAQRLESQGYDVFIAATKRSGKTLHRVRVGPVATRNDADQLASRLKSGGLPATVVGND
jgi:DedD protein